MHYPNTSSTSVLGEMKEGEECYMFSVRSRILAHNKYFAFLNVPNAQQIIGTGMLSERIKHKHSHGGI